MTLVQEIGAEIKGMASLSGENYFDVVMFLPIMFRMISQQMIEKTYIRLLKTDLTALCQIISIKMQIMICST